MNELEKIFGPDHVWTNHGRAYPISYCEQCETYIITCPRCSNGSCSGGGCDECILDQGDFEKLKPSPFSYISEEDRKVVERFNRIKHLLPVCLSIGKPLSIGWLHSEGRLSENDMKTFGFAPLPRSSSTEARS